MSRIHSVTLLYDADSNQYCTQIIRYVGLGEIFSRDASTNGATYLDTVVYIWLVGWLVGWHFKKFENFIAFQKFQNKNMFHAILSNFDVFDPPST